MSEKAIVTNRRARHDYHVIDAYEAGIALHGTEVKSLRQDGSIQLKDSYADVRHGELWLVGTHISPYDKGNIHNHKPERDRKLLMHKREILKLGQRVEEKGLTLIPLKLYFKHGIVKVQVGLCRGKQTHDKRHSIKEREVKKEIDRAQKAYKRG